MTANRSAKVPNKSKLMALWRARACCLPPGRNGKFVRHHAAIMTGPLTLDSVRRGDDGAIFVPPVIADWGAVLRFKEAISPLPLRPKVC